LPCREQARRRFGRIGPVQQGPPVRLPLHPPEGFVDRYPQPEGLGARRHFVKPARCGRPPSTGREDHLALPEETPPYASLSLTKVGFAMGRENLRNGQSGLDAHGVVEVDEPPAERRRERPADPALARAHEPDQENPLDWLHLQSGPWRGRRRGSRSALAGRPCSAALTEPALFQVREIRLEVAPQLSQRVAAELLQDRVG